MKNVSNFNFRKLYLCALLDSNNYFVYCRFASSRQTLTWVPDSFFSSLLSGRIPSIKDETGAVSVITLLHKYFSSFLTDIFIVRSSIL